MGHLGKKRSRKPGKQAQLHIEHLESRLVPASYVWNTDSNGFWDDAANWSPSSVPGADDSISINRGAANPVITIRDSRVIKYLDLCEKLVIQSGTVECAGPWSLAGDSSFTSTLEIAQGGTMSLRGGSVGGDYRPAFTNSGTIIVGAGNQNLSGMPLTNLPTGVISWEDGATLSGNSHIINQGTFRKPAGTGTSALTKTWSNRGGTIQVDAGTLEMTNNMADVSGMRFVVAQGAKAFLSGDLRNWSGTITGSGTGIVQMGDSSRAANIILAEAGLPPTDATFNFAKDMLVIERGGLNSVFANGIGNGTLTNNGFIRMGGTNPNDTTFDTLNILNNGTIAFAQSSNFNFRNTGLTNAAQGVISIESDGTFSATTNLNGVIANEGRIVKTSGTGTSVMSLAVQFKPGGVIEAQSGTLQINGVVGLGNLGNDVPTSLGGSFTASTGATVLLTGTHKMQGTYSGSGPGNLQFGDANNPAYVSLSTRDENGNSQPTNATFNFDPGFALYRRGVVSSVFVSGVGNGTLTNTGFIRFGGTNTNETNFDTLSVNNIGTIAFAQSSNFNFRNTGLTNAAQGVISIESDGTFSATTNLNGVIANEGRIVKTSGTGTSVMSLAVQFKPGGVIEAQSGTLQINGVVGLGNLGNDVPTSLGGSFTASAGATVLLTGTHKMQGTYSGSGPGYLQFGDANNPAYVSLSTRDENGNSQPTNATFNFAPGFAHFRRSVFSSVSYAARGMLNNTGEITLDQAGNDHLRVYDSTINNTGSIVFANAPGTGMGLQNTTINNTGTMDFTNNSIVYILYQSATIQNSGLLLKSAGTGVTTVGGVIMRPEGTVESRAGTLELRGFGGAPASTGGTFAASNGATILLTENHYLQGSYSGTGLGTVQIGTTDTSYPNTAIRVEQAGASFNFADGLLHFVRGLIYSDNIQDVGFSTLANNGAMSIDGGEANFSGFAAINNPGTIIVSPSGQLRLFNGTLRNYTGGLLEFRGGGGAVGNGSIDNRGILRQMTALSVTISTPTALRREGVIDIRAGTLNLSGDYSVLEGGSFLLGLGAELRATGYAPTLGGEFTGSGGGRFTLTSTAVLAPTGISLNFSPDMLHFSGGGFYNATNIRADFVNQGFLTIDSGGSRQESGFTNVDIRNLGTIKITGAGLRLRSSTLDNTGSMELRDGAEVIRDSGSVTNRGRIVKAGTGTASFLTSLNNQGSVEVPEGTLTFSQYGSTAIQNYSTSNGGTLTGGSWKVSGTGNMDLGKLDNSTDPISVISGATIQVDGVTAFFDGLNSLKSNAGTFILSAGADLNLSANDFTNAGLLGLGSGSVLSVNSFAQAALGGLDVGLGGLPADGKFGKVAVSQAASLAGNLKVEIEGGYGITAGQTYSFISAGSGLSGQFDSVTGIKLGRVTLMELRSTATTRDIATLLPAPDIAAAADKSTYSETLRGFSGENITINWTVTNLGGTDASGNWTDSVYLSSDDAFDLDDILVGRVEHTDGLAAGKSYKGTLTAKVPAVTGSYKVIVIADGQARLSDINRANNASAEASFRVISHRSIAPGASEPVPLVAGGVAYRQVTLAAGQSVRVEPQSGLLGSLLFASAGDGAPDLATRVPASDSLPVLSGPGTFVVAIIAGPGYSASMATISMAVRPLAVTAIDTTRVGAGGTATIAIRGSAFQSGATVSLVDPDNQLPAIQATIVRVVDESTIMATFNLTGAAIGRRKARVAINSSSATSEGTVEVTPSAMASFSAQVITPETVRPKVPFDGKVVITNTGTSDALVPLLALSQSAPYKFVRSGDGWMNLADTLQLVAHPGDGRNFLRPGESVAIPFKAYANTNDAHVRDTVTLSVIGADNQEAFDPTTLDTAFAESGDIRPAAIALMKSRVGTTGGSYVSYLGNVAGESASLGQVSYRVDELLQIAIRDISAKEILASARGKLAGISVKVARENGINLVNVDTGESYPAVIALNGTFAFHGVPRGYYSLKSDGFGILPTRVMVGDSMATLGRVNAVPFEPLSGAVINGSTGRAVAGALVTAEVAGQVVTSETDSRGRYSLMLQPSVPYNLSVSKDGLTELSTQLAIAAPTSRDFTLETGRILSGVVRNGANPSGGATVTLTGGGLFLQATTGSDGSYSFSGLSGGNFDIKASSGILISPIQTVNFTDAQYSLTANPLSLQPTVALTGIVTTGSPGTPLEGILVAFRGPDGRVRTTTTNSLGEYSLLVLPNQAGSLFTESAGFIQFRAPVNSGVNGLSTAIVLQALGSVSGAVTNGTAPVAGATIRLSSSTAPDSFVREVKTTSSGAYSIGSVPNGNYILEWLGNPLSGARQAITVSANQPVTANIRVSGCQITGAVLDITKIPSSGFPFIVLSGDQVVYSGSTDPMGRYSIEVAAAGTYRIVAQTAADSLASIQVEVGATERQLLDRNLLQGQPSRQLVVTNTTSQPVSGATVEARFGGFTLSATTDAAGRASFAGIIPEPVSLVALATDSSAVLSAVSLTGASDLPVQLRPNGSIEIVQSGSYSDENDDIVAVRLGTRLAVSGTTAWSGQLGIPIGNVPAGEYRVYVYAGQINSSFPPGTLLGISSNIVRVAAGQPYNPASIQWLGLAKRAIRLTDQNGNGLGSAIVTIKTDDGTVIDTKVADFSGLVLVSCPPSFVPCQVEVNFNGATMVAPTNLATGANGEVGITVPLVAVGLTPQSSYSLARGIIFPGVQNDLQEPHLLPEPYEDPENPCYAGAKALYDRAQLEIARFRSARDNTNTIWEALSDIEKATYGELATKAAIAGGKLIVSTLSIGNSFSKLSPDQLRNGLPEDIAGYFNNLFTFFGNLADVKGSDISDQIANNGNTSLGTWQNVLQALTSQGAALIDVAKDNLAKIGQLSANAGRAVPLLDAASNILIQVIALYDIKNQLDKIVQDAKRFETYEVSQQLYFTAYKRACDAAKAYNDYFTSPAGTPCPPPPPPPPPSMPPFPTTYPGPETQTPHDPNDILGPNGVGALRFVGHPDTLTYTIRFENAPVPPSTFVAPAAIVTLTQSLDTDLDASSVRFFGAGFADVNLTFSDARFVHTRYDDRAISGLFVDLDGYVDIPTRTIHWSFTSIDPLTGEAPADASLGFLAMNNAAHAGEGYLTYSVKPASGASDAARIDAVASIVFDTNAAIPTPAIFNTIDSSAPVPGSLGIATIAGQADSKTLVLLGARTVTLKWSAGTDTNSSGIATHSLQVSSDGGTSFTDIVSNTTATSADFTPDVGTRYQFRLVATDRVGNITSLPAASIADLYVTASSSATVRRSGDNIQASASDATPAFLTRPLSDPTSVDFLGTHAAGNALTVNLSAGGTFTMPVRFLGGSGGDTFTLIEGTNASPPVAGGGLSFVGNGGTDTIRAQGNANWTLTNSLITSSLGHKVALSGVESADITGGAGNNVIDASLFTGTTVLQGGLGNDILKGGKGRDTVREYGDRTTSFTLTNTRLTGLGTDTLSGIEDAALVGGSGNNSFDLSLFTGTATIDCYAGGTDTVKGSKGVTALSAADNGAVAHNFTLTSTRLTHPSGVVNFTSVERVELFGGASANTFDVSTYTGSTTLHGGGGTDTVVATRDAGFTLSDTVLSITGGGTHALDGIKAARLTGGASANAFTIGAWTGRATLNGSTGLDTLVASGDFNFTLGASSLAISSGASVAFSAIEKARLTGGNSANSLDASLFTGSVMLFGLDGNDTIKGAKGASVLVGGNGRDSLYAGTGRSILIGGAAADTISGGSADDLIVHGSTRYDANTTALDALLAEWSRTTATYALRVSHLRTGAGGLNGVNKLTGAITDDIASDELAGAGGQDWFFARVTAPADIVSDRASNENLN